MVILILKGDSVPCSNNVENHALQLCKTNLYVIEVKKEYAVSGNPHRGKCYFAAIALLKFLGGKDAGYALFKAIDDENIPHYWVQNREGRILDPTSEQYDLLEIDPPYSVGKKVGYRGNVKGHLPLLQRMKETTKL